MQDQGLLDQVYASFGGERMDSALAVGFNKVATDLKFDPTTIALEMSKKNSSEAINSSLSPDFTSSLPAGSSATLKGFPVTQAFGNNNPGVEVFSHGINTGVDIGTPKNTPVSLPSGNWKVLDAFNKATKGYVGDNENSGYGNSVLVQNLATGEKLRFSHLSAVNTPKSILQGGQVIGLTGATGNVTGPHIDIEYHTPQGQLGDFLSTPYAKEVGL